MSPVQVLQVQSRFYNMPVGRQHDDDGNQYNESMKRNK
jgi:hypothetical protein